jgi:hypothetical protein
MSGVLARFPWLLPVRNSFAGYGASAVTRTRDRGHVAEVKNQCRRVSGSQSGFPKKPFSPLMSTCAVNLSGTYIALSGTSVAATGTPAARRASTARGMPQVPTTVKAAVGRSRSSVSAAMLVRTPACSASSACVRQSVLFECAVLPQPL